MQAPDPSKTPTSDYRDSDSFQVEAQGHAFTFYPAGSDRLEALIDHIDKTERTLDVFYYMFQDDSSGQMVLDALVAAAKRGVKVALIIDDFGSDAPASFFDPLVEAGGDFKVFSADWNVRYLIRNHQKFAVADNVRVMTGGSNVSDHYYNPPEDNGWCDLGVAIEGDIAERFTEWFKLLHEWTHGSGSQLRTVRKMVRNWDPGEGKVQLLMSGPLVRRSHWAYRFKKDLAKAKRLDLVTAYFGPPLSIRRQIRKLARRGKARLVTAGKSDIDATIYVARLFYKRLLKAGAKIVEFQPCKLHMKLLIADDASYFGSANLDRRSIRINIELMVRVEDEALAERLREFIGHLENASVHVDDKWYAEHNRFFNRLRWRFYHMISLLDYRVARGLSGTKSA
ncbi:phosphatidylserine/phosphatidylglycerophosphate/cardiolipin synthase family protein [Erythrobacter sp. MTPC3]|uniref:phospholipase D-like domain-containing protein n=1 Tax=Erythrobacter sp. MTPC3 TaxID=3056564 RepID=UPI0036F3AD0B